MVRAAWLKSFRAAFVGLNGPRRPKLRAPLAADVRTMEPRVLLAATTLDDGGDSPWQQVADFSMTDTSHGISYLNLSDYAALTVNDTALQQTLDAAPNQDAFNFSVDTSTLTLVDPDGNLERFAIYETAVMAPELAAQFPNIKTYAGVGIDDPSARAQFDLTPQGFHAQVLSEHGRWYVDPYYHLNDDFYASYYASDAVYSPEQRGGALGGEDPAALDDILPQSVISAASTTPGTAARSGTQLRTYRTAVAADGEYTAFHGGTVPLGQAAIVTAINRVTGIYENELSIRLQLIANNSSLVYTNAATDPYTNNDPNALLDENQANLDTVIGTANYDIGHVFTTGGGGLAGLGVVGNASLKAWGETGLSSPTGDVFYVDYVAHEMGHQFGAEHTFNTSADPNREATSAYEPGSGSTIMGYAGVISPASENLQNHSDPYFHSRSFDQIIAYVDTAIPGVGTRTATGNTVPTANAGADFTIPASTPFTLTASGSDGNGDSLTYNWEERDLGPAVLLTAPDNGSSPLFRSFNPTSSPSRTFPSLSTVLGGAAIKGEKLPTTTRNMNFRATVRDNRAGGGGVNTDDMIVHVVNTGAAFAVTSQNSGGSLVGNTVQTVTWNVAGTTANGINAANVKISLSTDGGATFGTVLAANTPNDGSQAITLPNTATTTARIKVEAVGNIFFDITDANFTITAGGNQSPVMNNQTFRVNEGATNGTVVGTIVATDPDAGQTLSFFPFFESNPGVFDVNLGTGVITVANSAALTAGLSATIGVDVTDNGTPPLSDTADMTIIVNDVPAIGGAAANQTMNDTQTKAVFNTLTVADTDTQSMTAVVRINNGVVRGDFTAGTTAGWTRTVSGNNIQYSRTFASAANIGSVVQTAVRALVFDPRENAITPGLTETTTFNVTVADGVASPVLNTSTSVIVTSLNNTPSIGGAVANQAVNDNATKAPFSTLTVTDLDLQEMLVTVRIINGVVRGDFTVGSATGWTRSTLGNNITYVRYFSPTANIGGTVQTALRALIFQPRNNAIEPGLTETTGFSVTVSDGVASPVVNTTTTLITTSVNNAPTIGGAAASQTMNDNQTKAVFSTLTVTDPDNQDILAKVTIPNGVNRGDFTVASRAGWTRTVTGNNIVYSRFFAAALNNGAVVQAAIRALVFQPRTNVPIGTSETTAFTVFVNDGVANVTNTTTTVITTGVAPRPDADLAVPPELLASDISTVVVPTVKKSATNGLARLLKKAK